jgi:uncharacterized cupredoxin-like copper-binding protein
VALPAVLTALLVAGSGCATEDATRSGTRVVRVSERDFRISAPQRLAAGAVDIAVRNHGPDAHELIAVRTDRTRLPLRSDGATINEEALEDVEVGTLEPGEPGGLRHLRVRLKPGRYELFCNMAGHYAGGMHRGLVVR